jgi:hypothetical protein
MYEGYLNLVLFDDDDEHSEDEEGEDEERDTCE